MFELISETEYRETMENTVEPQLAAIREELSMPLEDGGVLHAELYEQQSATRAVIVLHGYTESGEKFREMTWYFLQSGFNVYAIDHRGHGKSARSVEETWLTHVDHFSDYVNDLEAFMDHVVLPRTKNLPLCLYAHSMGGAVGGMTLQRHPKRFARAVLTAPMIAPSAKQKRWRLSASRSTQKTRRSRLLSAQAARVLTTTRASGLKTRICKTPRRPTAGSRKPSA